MACGVFAYRGSGPCVDGTRPSVGHRADPSCRGARMPESRSGAHGRNHEHNQSGRGVWGI